MRGLRRQIHVAPTISIDSNAVYGYGAAATMVQVLKQCGDDLTRENVMKQAANLKDLELPMLLPGIKINTSPTNYSPIRQMQLATFNGESWQLFGELMTSWCERQSPRGALRMDAKRLDEGQYSVPIFG